MANIKSAQKRAETTLRNTERNKARKSRIKTFIKKVESAIEAKDLKVANEAFKAAQPEIQKAVSKGVLHKNTADRKVSRLNARIKTLA